MEATPNHEGMKTQTCSVTALQCVSQGQSAAGRHHAASSPAELRDEGHEGGCVLQEPCRNLLHEPKYPNNTFALEIRQT